MGGAAALAGALIALKLKMPLPWFLGPLLVVAALRLASVPIASFRPFQFLGQGIIGLSLGLYFTPDIVAIIVQHWLPIAISTLVPLVLAAFGTWVLSTIGGADIKTSWFASAVGGANEMSQLADRYGGRMDLVATSHSLRILTAVIVLPFGYQALGVMGTDATLLSSQNIAASALLYVIPLATMLGFVAFRRRVPNAWVLGPLFAAMFMTVTQTVNMALPTEVTNLGQLLLGWALGDRYRPAFFKAAPRFLLAVLIYTIGALFFASAVGLLLANISGIPLATVWLGVAPGGLAEMAITAKVLSLGVPFVVAFQVIRMVFVVLVSGPLYVYFVKRWETRGSREDGGGSC